jgi:hypothetical protein
LESHETILKEKRFFFCSKADIGAVRKDGENEERGNIRGMTQPSQRPGGWLCYSRESGIQNFSKLLLDFLDSRFRGND